MLINQKKKPSYISTMSHQAEFPILLDIISHSYRLISDTLKENCTLKT